MTDTIRDNERDVFDSIWLVPRIQRSKISLHFQDPLQTFYLLYYFSYFPSHRYFFIPTYSWSHNSPEEVTFYDPDSSP